MKKLITDVLCGRFKTTFIYLITLTQAAPIPYVYGHSFESHVVCALILAIGFGAQWLLDKLLIKGEM